MINVSINESINVSIKLSTTEKEVLNILKTNFHVNKKQISLQINKTEMTVQRAIKKLIEKKLIVRVGSNKTGYWKVIDK